MAIPFCSGPAGGGGCGGSRCSTFEWQVVIYADLCSRSEPPDKSITSYYREPESKRPSAETGDFILYQVRIQNTHIDGIIRVKCAYRGVLLLIPLSCSWVNRARRQEKRKSALLSQAYLLYRIYIYIIHSNTKIKEQNVFSHIIEKLFPLLLKSRCDVYYFLIGMLNVKLQPAAS